MFKIEKDIPLPTYAGVYSETLHAMEVGDSFLVPDEYAPAIRSAIARVYKSPINTRQFTTRSVEDGVRVWRVK